MEKNKFNYTYYSPTNKERQEIERIREGYLPECEEYEKFVRLKKLDDKVKNAPTAIAMILGVIGTLIFGTGLTCILQWSMWVIGIIACVVGVLVLSLAYPIYNKVYKGLKEKHSQEILELTEQLLSSNNDKE